MLSLSLSRGIEPTLKEVERGGSYSSNHQFKGHHYYCKQINYRIIIIMLTTCMYYGSIVT